MERIVLRRNKMAGETIRKIDEGKMGVTKQPDEEVFLKDTLLKQKAYLEKKLQETNARLAVFG